MQVLCVVSDDDDAVTICPSCGRRFAVYYSRPSTSECEAALLAVRDALLGHHLEDATPAAHVSAMFNVPAWNGPAHMSAAALLSGAFLRSEVVKAMGAGAGRSL